MVFFEISKSQKSLGKASTNGLRARDTRAVQVLGRADSTAPRSGPAAHISDVLAGKVKDEDTVEVSVDYDDEDLHGRRVPVMSSNSRTYNRNKI